MVAVQALWTVYFCVHTHPAFTSIYYPVISTPFAAALALATVDASAPSVDALLFRSPTVRVA
ncbi:MAG: hypothetical protein JWO39_2624 [Gemmatimonadetes bacterium]|jgi:hypothetical protein|nr:hypothetical protein [Gemmatimonadota bacterium]